MSQVLKIKHCETTADFCRNSSFQGKARQKIIILGSIFTLENHSFSTSIFLNKFSFPALETALTTEFSPSLVFSLTFWPSLPFTGTAAAFSFWPFCKHVFLDFYDLNAFWVILLIRESPSPSPQLLAFLVKSRASSEFCPNFALAVFLNRHNSQKMSWQDREIALGRASKHTSCWRHSKFTQSKLRAKMLTKCYTLTNSYGK